MENLKRLNEKDLREMGISKRGMYYASVWKHYMQNQL